VHLFYLESNYYFFKIGKIHALNTKYIPIENKERILKTTDDKFVFRGGAVFVFGLVVLILSQGIMKIFVPGSILMVVGVQMIFTGFLITILNQN